jgi:hypothetical protein
MFQIILSSKVKNFSLPCASIRKNYPSALHLRINQNLNKNHDAINKSLSEKTINPALYKRSIFTGGSYGGKISGKSCNHTLRCKKL